MSDLDSWRKQKISELFNELNSQFAGTDIVRLQKLETLAGEAYDLMYDAEHPSYFYSIAKDALDDSALLARTLGKEDDVKGLWQRRLHIKGVFHYQFSD
jgi:hypothetical protein